MTTRAKLFGNRTKEEKKNILRESLNKIFDKEDDLRKLIIQQDKIITKEYFEGVSEKSLKQRQRLNINIDYDLKQLRELKNNHKIIKEEFKRDSKK